MTIAELIAKVWRLPFLPKMPIDATSERLAPMARMGNGGTNGEEEEFL